MAALSPRQAARKMRELKARLDRNVRQAVLDTVKDAVQTAVKHSQGRYTLAQLAKMGHPYAVRHLFALQGGGAPFGGKVINYQSGTFAASWTWSAPVRDSAGFIRAKVWNRAPYASFLESGTVLMWARPINAIVAAEVRPRFERRMRKALDQTFASI